MLILLVLGCATVPLAAADGPVLVPGGLVVHATCGDAEFTEQLLKSDRYLIQGLDVDPANVRAARQRIQQSGLSGKITIQEFNGRSLPYVDCLVNQLIDSSDAPGLDAAEIYRVLVPFGVVMVRRQTLADRSFGGETWQPVELPPEYSQWAAYRKTWPSELDEWTHWLHSPSNNAVSQDRQVGVSRNLQWIMPPLWARNHNLLPSVSAMVSARGRLYYIIDNGGIGVRGLPDRWHLVARDAFNGLELWRHPIENWGWKRWSDLEFSGMMRFKGPSQLFRRLVADGEVLYATLGFDEPVVAIDGATGEILREYAGTERAAEILYEDGLLLLARRAAADQPRQDILAVDAASGKIVWDNSGHRGTSGHGDELSRFPDAYLTSGGGRLYFIDGDDIIALDRSTGNQLWRTARPEMPKDILGHYDFNHANLCTLVFSDGILFLGQMYPFKDNLNSRQQKDMVLRAMNAETGETMWEFPGMSLAHFTPPDLFIAQGLVWTLKPKDVSLLGLDPRTGEIRREYPVKEMLVKHHHRCYRNKATEQFYLAGEEGIEYIDFGSGELDVHHWMRGACDYGILPANGCIYLPTHSCGCHRNAKLHGFIALTTRDLPEQKDEAAKRLTRGPTAVPPGPSATAEDWPMFKSQPDRSNAVATDLHAQLQLRWTANLGGGLTAPIAVGERVFVASQAKHELYSLNASTGRLVWSVMTDGAIDTPPTYYRGKLIFGTQTGYVIALAAEDGRLAWRFRAAPVDVQLSAFSDLQSPWPVHGSVLVEGDRVYCVAGRSMHLNGGLYWYTLDADTGEVLNQNRWIANTEAIGELAGALLPDILIRDGDTVTVRGNPISLEDLALVPGSPRAKTLAANDGGLLDPTWFNSSFWKYGNNQGQMLVFDEQSVYGIAAYEKFVSKSYPHDIYVPGKGYRLFAANLQKQAAKPKDQRRGQAKSDSGIRWQQRIPVRAEAMAAVNGRLCLAGAPDVFPQRDPWATFDGRLGGVFQLLEKNDGQTVCELALDAPPVHDGLAAAWGGVYVSLQNGSVIAIGSP